MSIKKNTHTTIMNIYINKSQIHYTTINRSSQPLSNGV